MRDYPGALSREVTLRGRGPLTYKQAKAVITKLLAAGELVSDRPGEVVFGSAHQRLYPAPTDPGKD